MCDQVLVVYTLFRTIFLSKNGFRSVRPYFIVPNEGEFPLPTTREHICRDEDGFMIYVPRDLERTQSGSISSPYPCKDCGWGI